MSEVGSFGQSQDFLSNISIDRYTMCITMCISHAHCTPWYKQAWSHLQMIYCTWIWIYWSKFNGNLIISGYMKIYSMPLVTSAAAAPSSPNMAWIHTKILDSFQHFCAKKTHIRFSHSFQLFRVGWKKHLFWLFLLFSSLSHKAASSR